MLNFFIKFKQLTLHSTPTFFVLFFTFFNILVSKNFFDFGVFIALHGIFFWFFYTPNLLPPFIILILGFLFVAFLIAILINAPTPSMSSVANGSFPRIFFER